MISTVSVIDLSGSEQDLGTEVNPFITMYLFFDCPFLFLGGAVVSVFGCGTN